MAFGNMYNQPNYYGNMNQNMGAQAPMNATTYFINSAAEAANFPGGFGTTVLISLNDNMMFIKNNQNTQTYKIAFQEPPKPANTNPLEERMSALESNFKQFMEQFGNFMNNSNNKIPQHQQEISNPNNNWDS